MTSRIANPGPFLKTAREFPEDLHMLALQSNKTYVETAIAVNNRIIGLFPVNRQAITGESWYISENLRQQTLRQVYTFTNTSPIPHGINFNSVSYFTRNFGEFTDGINWYGLISGSNVAIAGQISFYVTPTNINFLSGAGSPSLNKGIIVLEWMSNP